MKKETQKPIVLKLKAKHFKNTNFEGIDAFGNVLKDGCAIEKAAAEVFKTKNVLESIFELKVDKTYYSHKHYYSDSFDTDKEIAKASHPNKIIREIELIEL